MIYVLDSEINPQGYTNFPKVRSRAGVGVMFMVKDSIQVNPRPDLTPDCELIWLELIRPNALMGVMYRPPSSDSKDLLELQSTLMSLPQDTPLVLCGDFNAPHVDWTTRIVDSSAPLAELLCDISFDSGLEQLVENPLMVETSLIWCSPTATVLLVM